MLLPFDFAVIGIEEAEALHAFIKKRLIAKQIDNEEWSKVSHVYNSLEQFIKQHRHYHNELEWLK